MSIGERKASTIRIICGDPGRTNDPFGVVGVELDLDTRRIRIRLARQFLKTKYGVVADYLLTAKHNLKPHFMGLETNNRGKRVVTLYKEKYNLPMIGIHTSANLTEKTRDRGYSMDKPFMVGWLKELMDDKLLFFPTNPSADMRELQNQIVQIVGIKTPSGHTQYKAQRNRHDDLFMALLLCCNVARLYLRRQEMLA